MTDRCKRCGGCNIVNMPGSCNCPNLRAYYYSFEPTGNLDIDRVLSAVACAGSSFHHTEAWNENKSAYDGHKGNTPVEWIQNAANEAAEINRKALAHLAKEILELRKEIEQWEALKSPDVLHANLLRGTPATLSRDQLIHLLGNG